MLSSVGFIDSHKSQIEGIYLRYYGYFIDYYLIKCNFGWFYGSSFIYGTFYLIWYNGLNNYAAFYIFILISKFYNGISLM